jgi:hypothetical protein
MSLLLFVCGDAFSLTQEDGWAVASRPGELSHHRRLSQLIVKNKRRRFSGPLGMLRHERCRLLVWQKGDAVADQQDSKEMLIIQQRRLGRFGNNFEEAEEEAERVILCSRRLESVSETLIKFLGEKGARWPSFSRNLLQATINLHFRYLTRSDLNLINLYSRSVKKKKKR